MLKAAALNIVIIVSLMIAILSASLLTVAFYYKLAGQKKDRADRLNANVASGTAILLSAVSQASYASQVKEEGQTEFPADLYGDQQDSVILQQKHWGIYTLNTVQAFQQKDTIKRSFLSGLSYPDSSVIYLADEDRPLSLSGTTQLIGDAELPKSGVKAAYVEGKGLTDKQVVHGKIKNSTRELPVLQKQWIEEISRSFEETAGFAFNPKEKDSLVNSFFNPTLIYNLPQGQEQLSNLKLKGNIILISDQILTIHADIAIEDLQIYAPAIVIKDGFKGSCQLFARDSLIIGKNCNFSYPSFAGVFKSAESKVQSKISIGQGSKFSGILLSYEKKRSDLQTLISLAKGTTVQGEVYATGIIQLESPVNIYGKAYAKRFLMKTPSTIYENYLIDVMLNRKLLSKYYLSTALINRAAKDYKILKWLN